MMRAPASATLAVLALLILCPSVAAADELRLQQPLALRNGVTATNDAAHVEFVISFNLSSEGRAYVGASPKPGNLACTGCDAGSTGWKTEVLFAKPGEGDAKNLGTMVKDHPINLGNLSKDMVYTFQLRVTAPPGSARLPTNHTLDYVLAYHKPTSSDQSGGALDPSQPLQAVFEVQPITAQKTADTDPTGAASPMALALGILGGIVVIGTIVLVARRMRRPKGPT